MKYIIIGGGLSAVSLAYFLQNNVNISEIIILEKEEKTGGLCRTFQTKSINWDIGPHIIFSKDSEILQLMKNLLDKNKLEHRRSNRIIYKDQFLQYPFENDLSKLDKNDLEYCVNSFINNPYENYIPSNMLQFFLKTFGEGITNIYLCPYNEKIWKFSPAFMDTQMVERIPKPPKEDILRSAGGETVDGYLHQLYFSYPEYGGIEKVISSFTSKFNEKVKVYTNSEVNLVKKTKQGFSVSTKNGCEYFADKIISTIPLNSFVDIYADNNKSDVVIKAAKDLKYNSIAICIINVKKDHAGDNYAFMNANKDVIFHRISKLDFMGENYHIPNTTTYMIEVTYRKNDIIDKMSDSDLYQKIVKGLNTIGFTDTENDINFYEIKRFEYAYVIYDLLHRKNVDLIKNYLKKEGIIANGRFGTFEYLNMDAVIRQSKDLASSQ